MMDGLIPFENQNMFLFLICTFSRLLLTGEFQLCESFQRETRRDIYKGRRYGYGRYHGTHAGV